jgi:chromosome segregation ATPase
MQLQHTVQSLRDELESLKREYEKKMQSQLADMTIQINQLRQTIAALREELEHKNGH